MLLLPSLKLCTQKHSKVNYSRHKNHACITLEKAPLKSETIVAERQALIIVEASILS
jgi:hypothetical protein